MSERFAAEVGGTRLVLLRGDITTQDVDAIVNAANPELTPGGGVSGAIHRAGGPALTRAAAQIRRERGPLPTGEAVITPSGKLRARWVIHTVGPVWRGGRHREADLLARAYRSSLALAVAHLLRSIAFPSISTGVYGYPVEEAAPVALRAVRGFLRAHPQALDEVRFVLFSAGDLAAYRQAWEGLPAEAPDP
ncbi:MAG TPA: O-acetyl-ADP-ribose deacetylase [Candidatus Acetothermia bacterium]|nr:O-acetyl-ADP-ribose deacetylase [Candidatus Acetothermia bacterium]